MAKAPILVAGKLDPVKQAAFYAALDAWHKAQAAANAALEAAAPLVAAADEAAAALITGFFTNATEGTNTVELGFGKQLKYDQPISRSVDKTQLSVLQEFLNSTDDLSAETIALRDKVKEAMGACIVHKPDVSVSGFKSLDDDQKKLLGGLVVEKLGKPKLSIHIPKA